MNKVICILLLTISVSAFGQNKMVIKKTPQKLDTVSITGDILKISLTGDGEPAKEVTLPSGGSGSDGITQVASVTALRATSGTTTKDVYLKSYWSGLGYGGGRFTWHSTDVTGRGDDGGISFAASGGGYWVRTEPEFRATYFGLVDTSDLAAISKTHNTWEADNLTNVIPDGEKLILDPGYVFRTRGGFNWGYDQLKTIHVEGYGSTLLRGSQIQDSVKSNSSTWVRVAHPERWDTFQYISLFDGTDRMLSPGRIWKINGDTLFAGIGAGDYSTGDCYSQSYQMVFLKDGCTLRGLTFDGNLDSNSYYNYWGTSGAIYLSSNNAFVNRITIKNSPGEGILCFEENVVVDGFVIENCNGNGIHFGANNNVQVLNGIIKRVNNLARRSNIMTMGHEGGAIAHSDQVHGCMVSNIQIDSALVAIADLNGHDDSLNHYDRIQAYNCIRAVEFQQLAGGQTLRDLRLTNSRFYNCGEFIITSNVTGPADSTEYVRDIVIDNVQFYNTTLNLNARNYNVTMSNIYYDDTSSTEINATYCYHLKINGLVKNGGGRIYMAETPGAVLENFEMRNVNASHFLHLADAGSMIVRNGAFYQDNAPSGFIGIYGPRTGEVRDCYMKLGGSPSYGILCSGGVSGGLGTTVVNCTFITPSGVAGIRSYGGSSGDLYINNKVTSDISNASTNKEYGTINVTDDDITWGNTTTIKLLGKIRDSAGNLGTDGQVLTSDASGFTVWETPAAGSGLSGSGTTNKVTKWTGTSTLGNSQITDDGVDISLDAAGKVTLNVGSAGTNGIDYERAGVIEGSLNTAVYNTTYNGSMFGHNLSQAFAHINTTLNAYYMDLGGRGSSGIGGTSSGIFFGMKAASTSTETNLLTLDENGNVGIGGVTSPAQKLHVSGTARITGSDGTATNITGRDGDGDISNVSLGYGLNLVGGTLEVDTTEVATPGDLAALGGSGDITSVTADPYLTGGGTTGAINIGVDTTGTVGLATKYDISGKPSGSGSASRVPYWFNASTLTSEEQMMISNAIGNYIFGIGYTGGNGQFDDDLEAGASGYVAYDATIAGIGMHVNEHQWEIAAKRVDGTNSNLVFTEKGGSWPATPLMTLSNGGELTLPDVAGTGTRVATASSTGAIGALTNGSNGQYLGISGGALAWVTPSAGGVTSVTGTNNIIASPTTGAVIINDNQTNVAQVWNQGTETPSVSSSTPFKVDFFNASVGGISGQITASTSANTVTAVNSGTYRISYSLNVMATVTGTNTNSPIHSAEIYINGVTGSTSGFAKEATGSGLWATLARTEVHTLSAGSVIDLRYSTGTTGTYNVSIGQSYLTIQRIQ